VYSGSADSTIRVWDAAGERGWGEHTPLTVAMDREAEAHKAAARAAETLRREAAERIGGEYVPEPLKPLQRDLAELRQRKAGCLMTLIGHTSTVTALAVNPAVLVSGGADTVVLIWDTRDGRCLRRLRGHDGTVTAIALHDAHFATGSLDRQVRLWHISAVSPRNPAQAVDLVHVYRGHEAGVSALACVGDEVVSGDAAGVVIVWDRRRPAPARIHAVHHPGAAVRCLHFNATTIVSFGLDRRLVLSDLSSGEALQVTREPHGPALVLALGVDSERMFTVAADHSARVWELRGSGGMPAILPYRVKHGMKLSNVARMFGCTLAQVLRWNALRDEHAVYAGMTVVVAPPPGSKGYKKALRDQAEYDARRAASSVGEALSAAQQVEAAARAAAERLAEEERVESLKLAGVWVATGEEEEAAAAAAAAVGGDGGGGGGAPTPKPKARDVAAAMGGALLGGGTLAVSPGTLALMAGEGGPAQPRLPPLTAVDKSQFRLAKKVARELDVLRLARPEEEAAAPAAAPVVKPGGVLARRLELARKAAELASAAPPRPAAVGGGAGAGAGGGAGGGGSGRVNSSASSASSASAMSSRYNSSA
jgi:hypothetical protein